MIEASYLSFLKDAPKNFSLETVQLKNLFQLCSEIKMEMGFMKSTLDYENKSNESLSRTLIPQLSNYSADFIHNEDFSKVFKLTQIFLLLIEHVTREQFNSSSVITINKVCSENSEEDAALFEFTKETFESYVPIVKDLQTSKGKYKTLYSKAEKLFKELESKQKLGVLKQEEKILTLMTDFDYTKENLDSCEQDCVRLEDTLNEKLKNYFTTSVKFLINSMNNLKSALNVICENKIENLLKMRINHVLKIAEHLNSIDLANEDSTNFNSQNSFHLDVNLDDQFNKNNFQNSQYLKSLLSFLSSLLQKIANRKKQLIAFSKINSEIRKNYDIYISALTKKLKGNVHQVNLLKNCPALLQITNFFRNFYEISLKNEENFSKLIQSNLNTKLENILLDITAEEFFFNQVNYKLQKEYTSFTGNLEKINQSREKVSQSLERVKESIQKSSEDIQSFSKYEKQLIQLRTDEGNLNETCKEPYKNFRKFLEEFLEVLKKRIKSYKEKESTKNSELKECMLEIVDQKDKNLTHLTDFLQNRNQINFDKNTIVSYVRGICVGFAKEFNLFSSASGENLEDKINNLVNEKGILEEKLKDVKFLNKNGKFIPSTSSKELRLGDIFAEDDLNYLKSKQVSFILNKKNPAQRFSIKDFFSPSKLPEGRMKSKSQINSPKREEIKFKEIENRRDQREKNLSVGGVSITNYSFLSELNLLPKLKSFHNKRIDIFNSQNKRNFQSTIISNNQLGNIHLPLIFKSMFHPEYINQELGKSKNFFMSYMDIRQDYNVVLTKIEENLWKEKIPKFYGEDSIHGVFENEENLKQFIRNEIELASTEYSKIEYKYNFTHPILKKKFMGPSKLEVDDTIKVYFISPMCLIVEVFSSMSGFMMMDTFYSILQYKFDCTWSINEGKVVFATNLTISFGLEFIKDTWFKSKILGEALSDMDEYVKTELMPLISKVITGQKNKYLTEENKNEVEEIVIIHENIPKNVPELQVINEIDEPLQTTHNIVIPNLTLDNNKQLYIWIAIFLFLFIFTIFPLHTATFITINLSGLVVIVLKLGEINERLLQLENKS